MISSTVHRATLVLAVVSAFAVGPVAAQEVDPSRLERPLYYQVRQANTLRTDPETGVARIRIDFRAYSDSTLGNPFTGDVDPQDVWARLRVNGDPWDVLAGPTRASADTIPMAFLLAVDVSTSMGPAEFQIPSEGEEHYERRMGPVVSGLRGFLTAEGIKDNENVYLQLMPFGHEVPQDLSDFAPDSAEWVGRWFRPVGRSKRVLAEAVTDLGRFVFDNREEPVYTALYGAVDKGMSMLIALGEDDSEPWRRSAKKILVVLTDGENHLGDYENTSVYSDVDVGTIRDRFGPSSGGAPEVYVIGFGDEVGRSRREMEGLQQLTSNRLRYIPVEGGRQAADQLAAVYQDIFEEAGEDWFVEIEVPRSQLRDFTASFAGVDSRLASMSMLLYPSALAEQESSRRLMTAGIALLALIVLFNVWYFTRPRQSDDEAMPEHITDSGEDPMMGEEIRPIEGAPAGISAQEYMRRKAQADSTS